VLVHPQSTIHSMVCYRDGSVLAQMGAPDMRTPIAYALSWPERMETTGRKLDFSRAMKLDFQPVDEKKFPAIPLAYDCLNEGLWACVAMNAANETLVQAFLDGKTGYLNIVRGVRAAVEAARPRQFSSVQDVISYDKTVRAAAFAAIGDHSRTRKATAL
ncbi:MAG: 1-deoxy-D-xylulose-5-phosphate reductoisomerase, partial [Proteobacteria bacterium]|nr:1-deoxy-D-xylulose-5-phosphate reductoisomerase [Pseudomonadota bacterium]